MNYYERAQELNEETIANRRYFHTNAEVGLDMPKAKAYVIKNLLSMGWNLRSVVMELPRH